jgi:hypothetical protein
MAPTRTSAMPCELVRNSPLHAMPCDPSLRTLVHPFFPLTSPFSPPPPLSALEAAQTQFDYYKANQGATGFTLPTTSAAGVGECAAYTPIKPADCPSSPSEYDLLPDCKQVHPPPHTHTHTHTPETHSLWGYPCQLALRTGLSSLVTFVPLPPPPLTHTSTC